MSKHYDPKKAFRVHPERWPDDDGASFTKWAEDNSIGHYIYIEDPVYIVDNLWIHALTLPMKSWPVVEESEDPLVSSQWSGESPHWKDLPDEELNLFRRRRWRWYLLRSRPEEFGYKGLSE